MSKIVTKPFTDRNLKIVEETETLFRVDGGNGRTYTLRTAPFNDLKILHKMSDEDISELFADLLQREVEHDNEKDKQ